MALTASNSSGFVRSVGGEDSWVSVKINGASSSFKRKKTFVGCYDYGGKKSSQNVPEKLEPLWDDGYGTQTMKDYARNRIAMDLIKSDGGPPRWFCPVACGMPLKDSPVLMYLPGIDGTGTGLVVHEKALGKVFHVQCLHIPVRDRTPLEGLLKIVEETMKIEHDLSPNKPIYLLGESFGGTLALAVAARNPTIDLILILANPATSYERSPLYSLVGFTRTLPDEHYWTFPYVMSFLLGDYVKMAMVNISGPKHSLSVGQLLGDLTEDIPLLSMMTTIIPKDTLKWRIKLVESAAAYANSRLHAITAQVLVLASGKDNLFPSKNEAQRLSRLLKHCKVRVFEENGHAILLESGVNVLSAIKATQMYRCSSKFDIFNDFLPPSMTEFKTLPMEAWWCRLSMGAAMFSTMEDGKIVRGLAGIPDEGPVLIVGNHMLWGFDYFVLVSEFMREKKTVLHGLAHPEIFQLGVEYEHIMMPCVDIMKVLGGIPVSGRNLFRLLARKSFTLLYPGGAREVFHRKGEGYKLFWPDKQEFVRMAVKCGATIIPLGFVGEDDILELIIDYNDMKRIPFLDQIVNEFNEGRTNLRISVSRITDTIFTVFISLYQLVSERRLWAESLFTQLLFMTLFTGLLFIGHCSHVLFIGGTVHSEVLFIRFCGMGSKLNNTDRIINLETDVAKMREEAEASRAESATQFQELMKAIKELNEDSSKGGKKKVKEPNIGFGSFSEDEEEEESVGSKKNNSGVKNRDRNDPTFLNKIF